MQRSWFRRTEWGVHLVVSAECRAAVYSVIQRSGTDLKATLPTWSLNGSLYGSALKPAGAATCKHAVTPADAHRVLLVLTAIGGQKACFLYDCYCGDTFLVCVRLSNSAAFHGNSVLEGAMALDAAGCRILDLFDTHMYAGTSTRSLDHDCRFLVCETVASSALIQGDASRWLRLGTVSIHTDSDTRQLALLSTIGTLIRLD
jgi:hypothetical protein